MRSLVILIVIQIAVGVFLSHNISLQPGFVSASPSPFQQWQRYAVKGEEFSVSLPALPAMNTRNVLIAPSKHRITRVLGSYGDGVAYAISTYENTLGQTLDDFVERTKQRRSRIREWTDQTDVTIDGFTGRQFSIAERGVSGLVQFFRTKDHLYQFEAMGAPMSDPRMQQFFTSLKLGKKLEGTEVDDGIGAQPDTQSSPVLPSKDLDQKVVVLTKPEPSYTESARRSRTVGAVVLRVVFASNGGVSDIEVVAGLPNGLTEQALKVVKQIRFVPGVKNGTYVSTTLQLEYNFNLY
ncbi:MAG TPA: energy transducer TonB [Pyrinomonadaceae bacterium]|nr:energy transducer TonB [Pyrinomonadaceae bacterium]